MKKNAELIISLAFLVVTAAGFYWLWMQSQDFTVDKVVAENLKPIDIETVKHDADKLLFGLENKAGLPIPTPVGKMGKENPFK